MKIFKIMAYTVVSIKIIGKIGFGTCFLQCLNSFYRLLLISNTAKFIKIFLTDL